MHDRNIEARIDKRVVLETDRDDHTEYFRWHSLYDLHYTTRLLLFINNHATTEESASGDGIEMKMLLLCSWQ